MIEILKGFLSNFLFMSNFENKKIINLNGPFLVSRTGDMEKTKKDINIFIFYKKILFNLDSRKVDMEVVNL